MLSETGTSLRVAPFSIQMNENCAGYKNNEYLQNFL